MLPRLHHCMTKHHCYSCASNNLLIWCVLSIYLFDVIHGISRSWDHAPLLDSAFQFRVGVILHVLIVGILFFSHVCLVVASKCNTPEYILSFWEFVSAPDLISGCQLSKDRQNWKYQSALRRYLINTSSAFSLGKSVGWSASGCNDYTCCPLCDS